LTRRKTREKKNERKKERKKEGRKDGGKFDKSLVSQTLCSRDMVAEKKTVCY
jgi:hypothetical protein